MQKEIKLAPSMMCCDFFNLKTQLEIFEQSQIELLHIDIMDGNFVPNLALGTDFVRQLKQQTRIPLDLHFMVDQPERQLDAFAFGENDYVSVHYESTRHIQRTLQAIRSRGARPLLAFNPGTPVEAAQDVLDDIDGLLIMTVNPGFAGQKMIPHAIEKIGRARAFLNEHNRTDAEIEVDGNVSLSNAIGMQNAGADIFVLGTSGIFCGNDLAENIQNFRRNLRE